MKKLVTLWIIMGLLYLNIEVIYSAWAGALVGVLPNVKYLSLAGWASLWMFFIGGFLGVALGSLNEFNVIRRNCNVFSQALLGTVLVLVLEFAAGMILNRGLGLALWDYSHLPVNLYGQISLLFAAYWFLLCPLVFWMDDLLRHVLYRKGNTYNLKEVYLGLFKFWKTGGVLQQDL